MTEMQRAAIEAIEKQQSGLKRGTVWMVGEQLKDICRREERSAGLLEKDLQNKEMSLQEAEKKVTEAENAAKAAEEKAEKLRKALSAADGDVAVFGERFSTVQVDFGNLRNAFDAVKAKDGEKAEKLRGAVMALLDKLREDVAAWRCTKSKEKDDE